MPRVLFVCLGNICRSPAAEGVFRSLVHKAGLEAQVEIASAGTIGYHKGVLPDARMRAAASRRGIELVSRARKFVREDFDRYDLIVPMDDENLEALRELARSEADLARLRPFCTFCTRHEDRFVPDPYYGGAEGFEHVLNLLEDGCEALLREVTRKA